MLQSGDTAATTSADHTLGQVSIKLPDLLKLMFDDKLYAHDTDTDQQNFLERLVQHQAGVYDMREKSTARRWLTAISLFILPFCMSACASGLLGGDSWKEEVLLHDGKKLIVERSVERGGRREPGQRPPIKEQSLSFTLPGTHEKVTWEDHYSEDLGQANFNPMLLEIANGTAYVLAAPSGCLSYNKWGRPNPPYVVFQYQGKAWNRILLQALPSEIKRPNLVISSPDDAAKNAKQRLLSAEMIRQENEGFRQPEYKTILREPLSKERINDMCVEMVYDGHGGWLGIDWFTMQPTYDACLNVCRRNEMSPQYCPCDRLFKGGK